MGKTVPSRGRAGRGAAVTPEPGGQATPAQRWLARLSLVLALAVVIVVVFAGLKSLAMLAVGVAAAVVSPGRRVRVLVPAGRAALAGAGGLRPGAGHGDRGLRVPRPAVGGCRSAAARLGAGVTARRALAGGQPDWPMP
jgi:hypothetical protein